MRRAISSGKALLTVAPGLACMAFASAASGQPSSDIDRRVTQAVAEHWNVGPEIIRLDWSALDTTAQLTADASFRLRGQGVDGWFAVTFDRGTAPSLAVRLRAGTETLVTVATRSIAPGTLLELADLAYETRLAWGPPHNRDVTSMIGWEVRRSVSSGEILHEPGVAPPRVIDAGDPITLVWERSGVAVSVTGTALNSARVGDQVRVRVEGRRDRVTGIAAADGTARLSIRGVS